MKKCADCNIEIIDNTDRCPFCKCVTGIINDTSVIGVGGYPDAIERAGRFRFVGNIIMFCSVVILIISIIANLAFTPDYLWCLIVLLGVMYVNVIIKYAIIGQSGYRQKTILLTLLGIAILFDIDALTGYYAWSVNYVFPGAVLVLDTVILILMIVNHRNWQSYIMLQIITVLLSLVLVLLYIVGIISFFPLVGITVLTSGLLLVGTIIIGDKRARTEIKRRFHF